MASGIEIIDSARLGALHRIGQGGQGIIYTVEKAVLRGQLLAYKEYKPALRPKIGFGTISALIGRLTDSNETEAQRLLERAAWPVALVRTGGQMSGFLMPLAEESFYGNVCHRSGSKTRVARRGEYLLNELGMTQYRELDLELAERVRLLHHLAETLVMLHAMGITVPDLSPRNFLYSLSKPKARSMLVDCDSLDIGGRCATGAVETPGWTGPPPQAGASATAADVYKFALLVLRVFGRSQSISSVADCTGVRFSDQVVELADRSLDATKSSSVTLNDWEAALRG